MAPRAGLGHRRPHLLPRLPAGTCPTTRPTFGDLCEDRDLDYQTQTAYAGAGPHPIVIGGDREIVALSQDTLPAEWKPEPASEVVLVGCAYQTLGDDELGTCSYSLGDAPVPLRLPLYNQEVTILVWELRTWEIVATVKFEAADDECPETTTLEPGSPGVGAATTTAELVAALEGVVTGAAP